MKTFFVNAPHNVEIKNFLRGDFYRLAKENPDIRLVVFVDPAAREKHASALGHERCIFEPIPNHNLDSDMLKQAFRILALASIPTESMRIRQSATYQNGGALLSFIAKRILWFLGHTRLWRSIVRAMEYHVFRDDGIWKNYFDVYKPDAVFAPCLILEEDFVFLKHAKRRKIPTLGMVRSWDNFSTKLFLRIHPNMLLVQNEIMKEEAMRWCDFPGERIRVVGFAQFSHYRDPLWQMTREEVAAKIGLEPKKKWIVYYTGGLPTVVLPKEIYTTHIGILKEALEKGEFGASTLAVRVHPTDPLGPGDKISGVPHINFGKNFEYSENDMKTLMNLIRVSDVVVNLGSTISLEAAVFDRPVVLVGFNGGYDAKVPLHHRLSFALDHTTHYLYVQKTGGVWRVSSAGELVEAVATYLANPGLHAEGRARIVRELVGPIDGKCGARVFDALRSLAN